MIVIDEKQFTEVASIIGYPMVPLIFDRQHVIENYFEPALREYFRWFPIKEEDVRDVNVGAYEIDFPDEDTHGIVDARPFRVGQTTSGTGSPFALALNTLSASGLYGQMGRAQILSLYQDAYQRSMQGYQRAFRVRCNRHKRKLEGNSNEYIKLFIIWAKHSNDWSDIHHSQYNNAIKYARGLLLQNQFMLRGQVDVESEVKLVNEILNDKAEKFIEEVLEEWQALSKVTALRS